MRPLICINAIGPRISKRAKRLAHLLNVKVNAHREAANHYDSFTRTVSLSCFINSEQRGDALLAHELGHAIDFRERKLEDKAIFGGWQEELAAEKLAWEKGRRFAKILGVLDEYEAVYSLIAPLLIAPDEILKKYSLHQLRDVEYKTNRA